MAAGRDEMIRLHRAGLIAQLAVTADGANVAARPVRSMRLSTQSEGCAADDRTGDLAVDLGHGHALRLAGLGRRHDARHTRRRRPVL